MILFALVVLVSVISIDGAFGQSVQPDIIQSAIVDVIFKPDPVIFNEPFKVEIVFRNPVDGKILSDVSYSTRTNFGQWDHSNIIGPIVEADGIVNQTAILKNGCCDRWIYEIQVSGFTNGTGATQTIRIPISVEIKDDTKSNKIKPTPIPILNTDGEGYSDSLDPCPFTIANKCNQLFVLKKKHLRYAPNLLEV